MNEDNVLIPRKDYLQYLNNDLKDINKYMYHSAYNQISDIYYDSLLKKRKRLENKIKELAI